MIRESDDQMIRRSITRLTECWCIAERTNYVAFKAFLFSAPIRIGFSFSHFLIF